MSEFKAKAAEWLRRLADSAEPLVITQNGKAAAVLISPSEYDALTERTRFLEAVGEGLTDAEAGRVISDEELGKRLDDELGDPEAE
ncbi:MAG: type II toxin-antitoxin system Phd/YefM family antitoxin [bacterium]